MLGLECANCQAPVRISGDDRLPPWCPKCGQNLQAVPARPPAGGARPPWAEGLDIRRAPSSAPVPPSRPRLTGEPVSNRDWRPSDQAASDDLAPAPAGGRGQLNVGLMVITGVLLAAFVYFAGRAIDKMTYPTVKGSVTGHTQSRKGFSMARVSYVYKGQTYETTSQSSIGDIGAPAEVMVPPDNPGNGTISSFSDLWLLPLILGAMGGACGVFFLQDLRDDRRAALAAAGRGP